MGVYPKPVTDLMDASVRHLVAHAQQSKLPAATAAQADR
jgi:NADH:ubiquinone oxidoreductase subunit 4 (subunit M)